MPKRIRSGFTFIELLVVVTVMMTITGFVTSSYNSHAAQQRVKQAAYDFRTNLRLMQSKATSGVKPLDVTCVTFLGYEVQVRTTGYSMGPLCLDGGGAQVRPASDWSAIPMQTDIAIEVPAPDSFRFGPLASGIDSNTDKTYRFSGAGYDANVVIRRNGAVDLGYMGVTP